MQTYHFKEIVNSEGVVTLSGLPPLTEVAIVVIHPELSQWKLRMSCLMDDMQQNHPFAKMSKEEILLQLRRTRDEVCNDVSRLVWIPMFGYLDS